VVLSAYAVPAAAVWALAGLVLCALPLTSAALVLAVLYGCAYGAVEISGAVRPAAPGRTWQVPQDLVIGARSGRHRLLIWGSILGPGFLTRNPYAGFAALPLLIAAAARPAGASLAAGAGVAALIGAAHGAGRAFALLRDRSIRPGDPMALLLRSVRWRIADGYGLLAAAGAAAVTAMSVLR
jgi:hypothetical protein